MNNNIIEKLKKVPVIPVLTLDNEVQALKVAEALNKGGLRNIEITLRTANALKCIASIKKEFPQLLIGAGTILKKEQFKQIKDLGVDFAVSPGFTSKLIKAAKEQNIPYLPAVSNPAQIMQVFEKGITFMKFFHASFFGGKKMLNVYKDLFPEVKFCPTGGIGFEDYNSYLNLKNVICLGGSWIVTKDDLEKNDFKNIENKAKQILEKL